MTVIEHAIIEIHPLVDLFPVMAQDEYERLRADIAAHGLREPVWLHPDGRLIDGRQRVRACAELGIECRHVCGRATVRWPSWWCR